MSDVDVPRTAVLKELGRWMAVAAAVVLVTYPLGWVSDYLFVTLGAGPIVSQTDGLEAHVGFALLGMSTVLVLAGAVVVVWGIWCLAEIRAEQRIEEAGSQ